MTSRGTTAQRDREPARTLTLLPAVDIAGAAAAQVVQGRDDDPWAAAAAWVDQGAEWVHLVDLDRAFGRGDNAGLLADMARDLPVPIQLSGGIADRATIGWAAGTEAARVVLASSALREPPLVRYAHEVLGERLVVAIDVRAGRVVSRGTDLDLGPLEQVLAQHPVVTDDVSQVLAADAARDGRRSGADLGLFTDVAARVAGQVTASGGISSLDDLAALRRLVTQGVTHVVLGAALYHGAFTVAEALEVTR